MKASSLTDEGKELEEDIDEEAGEEEEAEEFDESDFFEVYFLRSYPKPLTSAYQNSFRLSSSALLLRYSELTLLSLEDGDEGEAERMEPSSSLLLQFLPFNWEGSFFPDISPVGDSPHDHVQWNKTAHVVVSDRFFPSEWAEALYLGRINGAVRSSYLRWVKQTYMRHDMLFSPQYVCEYKSEDLFAPLGEGLNASCPIQLINWDTFVVKSLEVLSRYDVKLSSVLPLMGQKIIIQCASVSEKFLYEDKIPAYYRSFYSCMKEKKTLSYIAAINSCAAEMVDEYGYNFVNVGNVHYVRCGDREKSNNVGLFASETYYELPIPRPSVPLSYEVEGSVFDKVVAVVMVLMLTLGLFALVFKGYQSSKRRIERVRPRTEPHHNMSMQYNKNDELDDTRHGFSNGNSSGFGKQKAVNMAVETANQAPSSGFDEEGSSNKEIFNTVMEKMKKKSTVSGVKYESLRTLDDQFGDDEV